jgi:hypothetical protein
VEGIAVLRQHRDCSRFSYHDLLRVKGTETIELFDEITEQLSYMWPQ